MSIFSDYEVRKIGVKLNTASAVQRVAECVGSMEDECETRTVTKNCRGVTLKKRTFGTGAGTITLSMHTPTELREDIFALVRSDLKPGVLGYGRPNAHPEFCLTALVVDEDGIEKLVAYPRCVMETGPNFNVENGADEIEERELEVSFMPDDSGYGKYVALVAGLDSSISDAWFTDFTPELVAAADGDEIVTIESALYSVTAPVKAATPQASPDGGTGYPAAIAWSPTDSTFAASTAYTATVTLTAAAGYQFAGNFSAADIVGLPATSGTGAPATSVTVTRVSATSVTVVVAYEETDA